MKITLTYEFDTYEELEAHTGSESPANAEDKPKRTRAKKEPAETKAPETKQPDNVLQTTPVTGNPFDGLVSNAGNADPLSFLGAGEDPVTTGPRISKQDLRKKAGNIAIANPAHKDKIIAKLGEMKVADLTQIADTQINAFDDFLNTLK